MSLQATPTPRRAYARLRRLVLVAAAVVVGAIVLSGCVVIQSESAVQSNVIGNQVTVTTTFCASSSAAGAACSSPGNTGYPPNQATASNAGQLMVGYRIPQNFQAPPTIATTVNVSDPNGNVAPTQVTFTYDPNYSSGLGGLLGGPAGTQWVGYVSQVGLWTASGQQAITLAPTFTETSGSTPFTWRTVVGYRAKVWSDQNAPVQCPPPFPGKALVNPALTSQPSVCVDSPDLATINGPDNPLTMANLVLAAPATPSVAAGGTATLSFSAAFAGANPGGGIFAAAAGTTVPGATPSVTPANFAPAANSTTPLTVTFAVPASTPPGTYDVGLSATVAGIVRQATGHVTVTAPRTTTAAGGGAPKTATTAAGAKVTVSVKKTSLKVARKTGLSLTITVSKASATSLVATQTKPKVSVTVKKTVKAAKKTTYLVKSKKFHKGKVTLTFKGGGVTRTVTATLS